MTGKNSKNTSKSPPRSGGKGGDQLPPKRSQATDYAKSSNSDKNQGSKSINSDKSKSKTQPSTSGSTQVTSASTSTSTSTSRSISNSTNFRNPKPAVLSESETDSTHSDGRKRPLPDSAEKANPPPVAKKSFVDAVKGVKMTKLTIVKVKKSGQNNDFDFDNLNADEYNNYYNSLFELTFGSEVLIRRVAHVAGRCIVYCHDDATVQFVKDKTPQISDCLRAFTGQEGPNMAKFGALIPNPVINRKSDAQITDAIRKQVKGNVTLLSARDARGREGKYFEFATDRDGMDWLLQRQGLVGLGLVTVNLKIKRRPKDIDLEELRFDEMEVNDMANTSMDDTH